MNKVIVIIISLLLCILCLLLEKKDIIYYGSILYLIQFISITVSLFREEKNYIYIFSPSYICIAYLSLNFILGHYVVSRGIGLDLKYFYAFQNYESISFITVFLLLCNLFVFLAINFSKFKTLAASSFNFKYKIKNIYVFVLFAAFVLLGFIEVDLSFLGGASNFSYSLKLGLAIILVYIISRKGISRYMYYLLLLLLLLINHYENKREILYAVILILFFEILKKDSSIKIRPKQIFIATSTSILVLFIILTSSITRGYGHYDVDNPIDASYHVFDYLNTDGAKDALTANFELSTAYGNSSNAIDYVYKGEMDYLYGSTFLKFLFLPIPRSIFPEKPASMIEVYTRKFAPVLRASGTSYPISIYAEAFCNFGLFALFFILLIFYCMNIFYLKMIQYLKEDILNLNSIFLLYMYITLIQFIRGSGFEMWLLYALISLPLIYITIKFLKLDLLENRG